MSDLDSWKSWIDDLPIDGFDEGKEGLQDFLTTLQNKVDTLQQTMECIAGYRGKYNMPFPEGFAGYPSYVVVLSRETLSVLDTI